MIINTGCRTDIPAFYSEWFYNRIREGYVMARSPYRPELVTRWRLDPEVVDCIVFCTKNPQPMLERLGELKAFGQLWGVTVTPYGREIEPGVPAKEKVLDSFRRLSELAGPEAVYWRYDPIFLSEKYSLAFHLDAFERMAGELAGYTDSCVISFIDLYEKTKRNFPAARAVRREERIQIGQAFAETGAKYGMRIISCCEGTELASYGVDVSGCMTQERVERALGYSLEVPGRASAVREGCGCLLGSDIGVYNTCGHGCLYCYANASREAVRQNMALHDPSSPLLTGHLLPEDQVRDGTQKSWFSGQMRLAF